MTTSDNYTFAFLEEKGEALYIKVRAAPGAARNSVVGVHGDALKIAVSAAPERGKANRAICDVLAAALGLRASRVSLHSGETSRDKKVRVDGLSRAAAEARLSEAGVGQLGESEQR